LRAKKVKLKICKREGCDNEFTPFKSTDKFCSAECAYADPPAPKKRKSINPFSQKMLDRLAIWRPVRDKYLASHPVCEVHDCNKPSTNVHHRAGRMEWRLTYVPWLMACCETCHPKRIHENSEWAYEHGYLIHKDEPRPEDI